MRFASVLALVIRTRLVKALAVMAETVRPTRAPRF